MLIQTRQALNFVSYHSANIQPMHLLLNRSREPGQASAPRLFAKAAILEGVGWLILGAAVGYFSRSDVLKYMETTYSTLEDLDEIKQGWEHIFDIEWLRILLPVYPRELPKFDVLIAVERDLSHVYDSCVTLWSQLSRSVNVSDMTAELSFAPSKNLERHLIAGVQLDDIAEALASERNMIEMPRDIFSSTFYAGYGETIEFLASFRDVRNRYLLLYGDRAQGFLRKVAQLLRWRLFFFESRNPSFYLVLEKYLDILKVSEADARGQFRSYVRDLANGWADNQERRTASVGA
jgi:hypothetical protein